MVSLDTKYLSPAGGGGGGAEKKKKKKKIFFLQKIKKIFFLIFFLRKTFIQIIQKAFKNAISLGRSKTFQCNFVENLLFYCFIVAVSKINFLPKKLAFLKMLAQTTFSIIRGSSRLLLQYLVCKYYFSLRKWQFIPYILGNIFF